MKSRGVLLWHVIVSIPQQIMDAREKMKEMILQKDQIEKEIKELYDVLASVSHSGLEMTINT